uniref:NADH dehydrogenase subunit 2 n=1 Tax=Caenorhabditis plicata TaxID=281681 RepID=A0A1Z1GDA5_9PELO|nr:NADH dehydrogenase subunit 2 [Caenorhabditis plicata]ARV88250.1 NADH dehydrogenase subunit 2 [Caenorhabditis plicata]
MLFFLVFLTFCLTFISLVTSNIIIWWSVFLLMTICFILLNKSNKSYTSIFNYFIIQETLGLLFLLFSSGLLQFFIILMKIGVAPLHFWIFNVTNNVFNYGLMWFLTFQKLPFLVILLQLFWLSSTYLLILGLLVCNLQMFSTKGYKNLLILSSTESFNWVVLGLFFSFFNSLYLFFYYFILMIVLIPKFSKKMNNFINWETTLVFLNMPFSVTFFVKIFSLSEILKLDSFFVLFILFSMFLSGLSFSFWLINLSTKFNQGIFNNSKFFYFSLVPLSILSII